MSWGVSPWVYPVGASLLPGLWVTVSFPRLGKFSAIMVWNIFSALFSLFSFWDHYSANISVPDIAPEVFQTVLFNLSNFLFNLSSVQWQWFPLPRLPAHRFILLLHLFCYLFLLVYFFTKIIVFFNSTWLFFIFSRSLLIDHLTIIILNSFSGSLLFPLHLFGLLCF